MGSKKPLIFISYRRDDHPNYAGRLTDSLNAEKCFKDRVFRDINSLGAGNFVKAITEAVSSCHVLIALIGERWLADEKGRERLRDPKDFVRLELETALRGNVTVVPVTMETVKVPAADKLPGDLKALADYNAYPLTDVRWDYDVKHLIGVLKKAIGERESSFGILARVRGRAGELLRSKAVRYVAVGLAFIFTLVVPNAILIGGCTQWVALYYYQGGSLEYIVTRPDVYIQMAALQALSVSAYSFFWTRLIYPILRRWLGGPPPDSGARGGGEAHDTPRNE